MDQCAVCPNLTQPNPGYGHVRQNRSPNPIDPQDCGLLFCLIKTISCRYGPMQTYISHSVKSKDPLPLPSSYSRDRHQWKYDMYLCSQARDLCMYVYQIKKTQGAVSLYFSPAMCASLPYLQCPSYELRPLNFIIISLIEVAAYRNFYCVWGLPLG